MAKLNFNNQTVFNDFIVRLKAGKTTEEEEKEFEVALEQMSDELKTASKIILDNIK